MKYKLTVFSSITVLICMVLGSMVGCAPTEADTYDLTITSTTGGSVSTPGESTFTYDAGTVVYLEAEAQEGYYFADWSGDVITVANVNVPTTIITMNGDYEITANFEQIPIDHFALTITSTEGGSVTVPGEDVFICSPGMVIGLEADADEGYRFISWTGDVGTIGNTTAATTTITVSDSYSITANFVAVYDLTVASTDGGSVATPGEETYTYDTGTVVALVAEADEGYSFVKWTGDVGTVANIYDDETNITMNDNYAVTANFFEGQVIWDWYDLHAIRDNLSGNYLLMNDLDSNTDGYTELASSTADDGKGWQPLGDYTSANFTGTFDGQGYEIKDLFINRSSEDHVGLFGGVDAGGIIENVGVTDGTVSGNDKVGGLVGWNVGIVSNSYSTCNVTGSYFVGCLIGIHSGDVTNCSAAGDVSAVRYAGGLVGYNYFANVSSSHADGDVTASDMFAGGLAGLSDGDVSDCYATGNVNAPTASRIGGLMGRNDPTGTVDNCYSTGSVTGFSYVGGLMGENANTVSNSYSVGSVAAGGGLVGVNTGTVTNSFWDTQTSGQGSSAGGTGKTTAEMQDIDTFTGAGWDIVLIENYVDEIWYIDDGNDYAKLGWQFA